MQSVHITTKVMRGVLDTTVCDKLSVTCRGCRDRDRMEVGFTTTFAISAFHHSRSWRGVLDTALCDKVCQRQVFTGYSCFLYQ